MLRLAIQRCLLSSLVLLNLQRCACQPPTQLIITRLPADADEATALQHFMLAALKSFVRRYNVQCAQLAERIGAEVLGGEGVPQELREAVETQLNL